ncbi:MAG: hypothetical protein M3Y60_04710 [Bacteroidota bacterium]|nr:hypothetical protein [Bacteroidota bacterium]
MQNNLTHVLNRTLVKEFYRMNAGFFLFFGTLAFGFMSSIEHKALAQFFVGSIPSLMIPIGVWLLYMLKGLRFNIDQLNLPSHRFLFNMQFLSRAEQLRATAEFIILQFLPAIGYGVFLVLMALQQSAYWSAGTIALAQVIFIAAATRVMVHHLHNPRGELKVSVAKQFIDQHYVRHIIHFYTEWLLRSEPLTIAGIKILTGTLLWGVSALYLPEYDWRLIAMAVTVCGIANVPLLYHLTAFEHSRMSWLKNMPVTTLIRYIRLLAAGAIFSLVELIVLTRNFAGHLPAGWIVENMVYFLSLIALFVGYLQTRSAPLESVVKRTFWIFVVLILMILFKVPLSALILINVACGYMIFSKKYYLFESAQP